ncbi:MAG: hypothetical protein CMN72_07915 [Sphingomonas sp.]|nr:hypothetical protein [Sphingomonas sp.]
MREWPALLDPDVFGAAVGAGLAVIGAYAIERLRERRQRKSTNTQIFTIANALLTSIESLSYVPGPELGPTYRRARREKAAFERIVQRQPEISVPAIVAHVEFEEAWQQSFESIRGIIPADKIYDKEARLSAKYDSATDEIRASLKRLIDALD